VGRTIGIVVLVIFVGSMVFLATSSPLVDFQPQRAHVVYVKGMLQTLSTAAENYARDHEGLYPRRIEDLFSAQPFYLNQDLSVYQDGAKKGYVFQYSFSQKGYEVTAIPIEKNKQKDIKNFVIRTGGVASWKD
jgi:hypothetical protein